MQHFIHGLKPEGSHFMNVSEVAEVKTILEKVLTSIQYTCIFDDPPEPMEQPIEKQQIQVLSAASSPPPPYIEEITEPPKSPDHEPLI